MDSHEAEERPSARQPILRATERSLLAAKPDDRGFVRPRAGGTLNVQVGAGSAERAVRLLDMLLAKVQEAGIRIRVDRETGASLAIVHGEDLEVTLTEQRGRRRHAVTREERAKAKAHPFLYKIPEWDYFPSGVLVLRIHEPTVWSIRRQWAEGRRGPLEAQLDKFVAGLQRVAQAKTEARLRHEEEVRQRREQYRLDEEARQRRAEEERRRQELMAEVDQWRAAALIRDYVAAVEQRVLATDDSSNQTAQWARWVRGVADGMEPARLQERTEDTESRQPQSQIG
jgi:hypothetical protein